MSNNPYQISSSTENYAPMVQIPASMPWQLIVFAILFCIFGGLGILALPQAILGAVFQGMMPMPSANEEQAEVFSRIQQMSQNMMIPTIILGSIDTILGIGFLYSGIQLFRRKLSGAIWGTRLIIASIPGIIMRTGLQFYAVQQQMEIVEAMADSSQAGMEVAVKVGQVFGMIMLGSMIVISIVYYSLAYLVLTNRSHREFLRASENRSTGMA